MRDADHILIDPVCALHGLRADEHEFGRCLYCCICFNTLTPDTCYVDREGQRWDMCVSCGIHEDVMPDIEGVPA